MARLVAGGGHSAPAVDADSVYLAYACENVYRVDRATGAQVWWHRTGCSGGGELAGRPWRPGLHP